MRTRISKSAHVLERIGLAMAGAASGLFVGALVGAVIPALTTQGFLLIMMLAGADRILSRNRYAPGAFS